MKSKGLDFPHPLLNEFTNDYIDSDFSIEVIANSDNGADLVIDLNCELKCEGLLKLIAEGKAAAMLRIVCHRTSYRDVQTLVVNGKTAITIQKNKVADKLFLQAMVVAKEEMKGFSLGEFNQELFGGASFGVRKGDILADEPGIWVSLDTLVEKNVGGIVQVRCGEPNDPVKASFPDDNDENPATCDYIYVTLPLEMYKTYSQLRHKKYLKTGAERFLECSVALPALVEGIAKLRYEESVEDQDGEDVAHYSNTVWGRSIIDGLNKKGILSLEDCNKSDYELANLLLGDVIGDSINNLYTKSNEWSQAQWGDDNL